MDLPATIHSIGVLVTSIGVIVIAFWSYRGKERAAKAAEAAVAAAELAHKATEEIIVVHGEVRQVGDRIDGRLTELLTSSVALARAEGIAQGEQSQRDRAALPEGSGNATT